MLDKRTHGMLAQTKAAIPPPREPRSLRKRLKSWIDTAEVGVSFSHNQVSVMQEISTIIYTDGSVDIGDGSVDIDDGVCLDIIGGDDSVDIVDDDCVCLDINGSDDVLISMMKGVCVGYCCWYWW